MGGIQKRGQVRRCWSRCLVCIAFLLCFLPRTANAQGNANFFTCDACGPVLLGWGIGSTGLSAAVGLVADGIILSKFAKDEIPPRGMCMMGTIVWSINLGVAVSAMAIDQSELGFAIGGPIAAVSAASLGLSITGLLMNRGWDDTDDEEGPEDEEHEDDEDEDEDEREREDYASWQSASGLVALSPLVVSPTRRAAPGLHAVFRF